MAKYAAAFDGVLEAMLSDGAFGSLPHILEVDSDLTCSVMLASNMYDKQALQPFVASSNSRWRKFTTTLRLLGQMLANEETSPKPDGIICNVCQQINNVDVVSRDQQTIRLKCRVCSSEHGFYSEYAQKFGC